MAYTEPFTKKFEDLNDLSEYLLDSLGCSEDSEQFGLLRLHNSMIVYKEFFGRLYNVMNLNKLNRELIVTPFEFYCASDKFVAVGIKQDFKLVNGGELKFESKIEVNNHLHYQWVHHGHLKNGEDVIFSGSHEPTYMGNIVNYPQRYSAKIARLIRNS